MWLVNTQRLGTRSNCNQMVVDPSNNSFQPGARQAIPRKFEIKIQSSLTREVQKRRGHVQTMQSVSDVMCTYFDLHSETAKNQIHTVVSVQFGTAKLIVGFFRT